MSNKLSNHNKQEQEITVLANSVLLDIEVSKQHIG